MDALGDYGSDSGSESSSSTSSSRSSASRSTSSSRASSSNKAATGGKLPSALDLLNDKQWDTPQFLKHTYGDGEMTAEDFFNGTTSEEDKWALPPRLPSPEPEKKESRPTLAQLQADKAAQAEADAKKKLTFRQKEKRKRDMGMQNSDKDYVQEEKRILRSVGGTGEGGQGFA